MGPIITACIVFCPPLYVYSALRLCGFQENKGEKYFIVFFVCAIWLLFFFTSDNVILNFINATSSSAAFYVMNIHLHSDVSALRKEGQEYILNEFSMSLHSIASLVLMIAINKIPRDLLDGFAAIDINIISFNYYWTSIHKILLWLLLASWLIFLFIDRFKMVAWFPKYQLLKPEHAHNMGPLYMIHFMMILLLFKAIPDLIFYLF